MTLVLTLLIIITSTYLYLKYKYKYWARKGFPQHVPELLYGNMKDFAKKTKSFGIKIWDLYQETDKSIIGIYIFFSPSLLIRDVNLVKKVLVADVDHFIDRGVYINEKREPMSVSLMSLRNYRWKHLRQKLTPLFSSGKLKNMCPTILTEVDRLDRYMEKLAHDRSTVEMKDMLLRYVLNVIGSVFFGIDVDTISNPDHIFKQMHEQINNPDNINRIRVSLAFAAPKVLDLLGISRFNPKVKRFFMNIVQDTIEYREKNNVRRNDFMQLMVDLRRDDLSEGKSALSIPEIAGNSYLFYIAGTETTSLTAASCLYELALQPLLMRRVQEEIDDILAKYGQQITYDSIQEMEYLEMCIKETLRKYPGLPMLNRECTKDYKIPDSGLMIKKGTAILISIMGLHYDPKNFDEPEKFNPDRFRKGNETYNKDAYIPFGDGPRQCIAVRMGFFVAKAAVVKLLSHYNFESVDYKEIEFGNYAIGLVPKGGLPLKVSKRGCH